MRKFVLIFAFLFSSCAARRVSLVPLQSGGADGSVPTWVELRPGMELKVEGAYYREGSPRRGLTDYLGAESAKYEVLPDGALRLSSVSSFLNEKPGNKQPGDQPDVQQLIRSRNLRYRYHHLFFQVVMSRTGTIRPAVLLGSRSIAGLDNLTTQFLAGQHSTCGPGSSNQCTAFPAFCTASLAIEVVVNGVARKVIWGSTIASIAAHPRHVEIARVSKGQSDPVQLDLTDPGVLLAPLSHGDQVIWN